MAWEKLAQGSVLEERKKKKKKSQKFYPGVMASLQSLLTYGMVATPEKVRSQTSEEFSPPASGAKGLRRFVP